MLLFVGYLCGFINCLLLVTVVGITMGGLRGGGKSLYGHFNWNRDLERLGTDRGTSWGPSWGILLVKLVNVSWNSVKPTLAWQIRVKNQGRHQVCERFSVHRELCHGRRMVSSRQGGGIPQEEKSVSIFSYFLDPSYSPHFFSARRSRPKFWLDADLKKSMSM